MHTEGNHAIQKLGYRLPCTTADQQFV